MGDKFEKRGIIQSFSTGTYNKFNEKEQWIRLSQGCPNQCSFCYEPKEQIVYPIPEINRNFVKIMDMNLLAQDGAIKIIQELGQKRVNKKVVYYELVCGIDWRFLTFEIAQALKAARFRKIRLAWDFSYKNQFKIKDALNILVKASYKLKTVTMFMICNWKISYQECLKKLYLCAIWGTKVADCYFDGQVSPNIQPIGWTKEEIKDFRKRVRKHNQLINFGIDPELK